MCKYIYLTPIVVSLGLEQQNVFTRLQLERNTNLPKIGQSTYYLSKIIFTFKMYITYLLHLYSIKKNRFVIFIYCFHLHIDI